MPVLLLATGNPGKLSEIQAILGDLPCELVTPSQMGLRLEVQETGSTYAQNAALKALQFSQASGLVTLADDSGLEVDALQGQPGIKSARYSPLPGATDADRRKYLLTRLGEKPQPWTARFRCTIAVAFPGGELQFVEGQCQGVIISEERGQNGFGYDPLFYLPEYGQTMAELPLGLKNRLSHRGQALIAARPILSKWLQFGD